MGRKRSDRRGAPAAPAQRESFVSEMRRGVRTATALPLGSEKLGPSGTSRTSWNFTTSAVSSIPFPIEYKRGRPRAHRADEVQLCAQALCLEEMLSVPVPVGALFYGKTRRRRHDVAFDTPLRTLTLEVIAFVCAQIDNGLHAARGLPC